MLFFWLGLGAKQEHIRKGSRTNSTEWIIIQNYKNYSSKKIFDTLWYSTIIYNTLQAMTLYDTLQYSIISYITFNYIDTQWTNFSKSTDLSRDLAILFVQIFLRIGVGQLGLRLYSPNGSKWPDYWIVEIWRIVGWQLATLSFSPYLFWLLARKWSCSWQWINFD